MNPMNYKEQRVKYKEQLIKMSHEELIQECLRLRDDLEGARDYAKTCEEGCGEEVDRGRDEARYWEDRYNHEVHA